MKCRHCPESPSSRKKSGKDGATLDSELRGKGWSGPPAPSGPTGTKDQNPHFSQRTREMGHPAPFPFRQKNLSWRRRVTSRTADRALQSVHAVGTPSFPTSRVPAFYYFQLSSSRAT